ncbi:hypothetical protein ACFWB0_19385 [Rhodococcus sp. NPDC060086]|uniref:hypothetical protein n=1 Tax=Rhodococcus sp. NPDC060086 TaxID=3347055 RepID=UPI0036666ACF
MALSVLVGGSGVKVRVSSVVVALGAVLVLSGCGGSADEPDAAAEETTTVTTTSVTAAPATTEATTSETLPSELPPSETTTEAPTPEAPPTLAAVAFEQGESYYFTTPDGAFACGIVQLPGRTEAGCEGVTDPVPPQPENCVVNWGHGMRVVDSGPGEFLCSGGPVYLPVEGSAEVLPAGATLSQLGYTCATTEADVTCTNDTTGHGFTVASGSNETF